MKHSYLPLAWVMIIGLSALAYGKSKPLSDHQLDRISAGSAIADGESTATDSRDFQVELSGNALSGASGINIVNAADSTVANGANVWSADKLFDVEEVEQSNHIKQEGVPCDCGKPGEVAAETETRHEEEEDFARANAIALDGSKATSKTKESVELDGSAEAGAKALNIVNASGSMVANAVNLASSTNLHNLEELTQRNSINQSAH